MSIPRWSVAVCLYEEVGALDYQGPVEMLGAVELLLKKPGALPHKPKYLFDIEYLSKSLDPVKPLGGSALVHPTLTYHQALAEKKHYDLIIVPGLLLDPVPDDKAAVEFIAKAAPQAKYIVTICAGSYVLAKTGLLDGKKATTNKSEFKALTDPHPKVEWVKKARWVVDGNIWSSSGLTAGFDVSYAFVTYLLGEPIAKNIAIFLEYRPNLDADDDEFAAIHGLLTV